jgi:hypothetical protein
LAATGVPRKSSKDIAISFWLSGPSVQKCALTGQARRAAKAAEFAASIDAPGQKWLTDWGNFANSEGQSKNLASAPLD